MNTTKMQACLNEEASHFDRQYKKYPMLWALSFLYVGLGVSLLTLALQCNTRYSCSYDEQGVLLWFGLMILVSVVVFVILPNILRVLLNCFFERPIVSSVKKMSPLSLPQHSPKGSPKPPSTPPPKHALKSFREFVAEA